MLVGNKTKNYDFQSKVFLEKENCLILTRCWNHIFQRNFWEKKSIKWSRWRFGAFRILLRPPLYFLVNKKLFFNKSTLPNELFDLAFSKKCCINWISFFGQFNSNSISVNSLSFFKLHIQDECFTGFVWKWHNQINFNEVYLFPVMAVIGFQLQFWL